MEAWEIDLLFTKYHGKWTRKNEIVAEEESVKFD